MIKIILFTLLTLDSCSFLQRKGSWGKKAIYPLKMETIKTAFFSNAASPHFWGPLAGAGIIYLGNWDHKISDWATTEHPVYTTESKAGQYSNYFNDALKYETYGSALLTQSWSDEGEWTEYMANKLKGTVVVFTSYTQARAFNNYIRKFTFRTRPNKMNDESFPSGHATTASAGRTLSSKNLDSIGINQQIRNIANLMNTSMAAGAAWARVEGRSHYPTDVLVAYSLGHFISGFLYDALMNLDNNESFVFYPTQDKVMALYQLRF